MAHTYERSGKARIPDWWTDVLLDALEKTDKDHGELAKEASIAAGRKRHWDRSAVSKFKTGTVRTYELALGLGAALHVAPFLFRADSIGEAIALEQVQKAFHPSTQPPRVQQKVAVIDEHLAEHERNSRDHGHDVELRDERAVGGRRTRRTAGRRPSSS